MNCSDHNAVATEVASVRSLMRWLIVLLPALLALVGYNIHVTQQMEVRMASSLAKIGGQITTSSVRIKNIEHSIENNRFKIGDHEQRLRSLEQD